MDAARNYEKSKEYYLSGDAYAKSGDQNKALEVLQKVERLDRNYFGAINILGPILEERGFPELAIQRYKEITEEQHPFTSLMGCGVGGKASVAEGG